MAVDDEVVARVLAVREGDPVAAPPQVECDGEFGGVSLLLERCDPSSSARDRAARPDRADLLRFLRRRCGEKLSRDAVGRVVRAAPEALGELGAAEEQRRIVLPGGSDAAVDADVGPGGVVEG